MMYRCDTTDECGSEYCDHRKPHGYRVSGGLLAGCDAYRCFTAEVRVRCNPVATADAIRAKTFGICPTCGAHKDNYRETIGDCSEFHYGQTSKCPGLSPDGTCDATEAPCVPGSRSGCFVGTVHTCYYCNHMGTDVNRMPTRETKDILRDPCGEEYCCDGVADCDARWQQGQTAHDRMEEAIAQEISRTWPWQKLPHNILSMVVDGHLSLEVVDSDMELPF